jgi:beta-lactamase class A
MSPVTDSVEQRIRAVFDAVGARGFIHVRQIGGPQGAAVDLEADMPVATASVIKILVALAFARRAAEGAIDPTERVLVPERLRVGGPGTTGCLDPVEMSLRDLALFMMNVSDNAATDVVWDRAGWPAIGEIITDLGLSATHVRANMATGHMRTVTALGLEHPRDLDAQIERADEAAVWSLGLIDPERANASTPREVGRLLEAIWTDRAGPPQACAFVRSLMGQQVTTHRLAAGFDVPGVAVAGKTGTLPAIRNEAGVVAYPDGRRYVAAIFTRAESLADRRPDIDAAIGRAARIAVDHLRS